MSSQPEPPPPAPDQQAQVRRLTAEEMRALRECGRESFYYRSLPFAIAGVLGVRYLGSLGYLKPSPTYGWYMKYTAAVAIGYFTGKFSYLGKCREKILNLPNSELAEALRRRQGGGKRQLEVFQEMVTLPELGSGSGTGGGGGGDQGYSPMREGSDMYISPDFVSGQSPDAQQAQQAPKSTSYDERRRQNREEYLRQQFGVGGSSTPGQQQQQQQQQQQPQQPQQWQQQQKESSSSQDAQQKSKYTYSGPQPPEKPVSTTKYGDTDFK